MKHAEKLVFLKQNLMPVKENNMGSGHCGSRLSDWSIFNLSTFDLSIFNLSTSDLSIFNFSESKQKFTFVIIARKTC